MDSGSGDAASAGASPAPPCEWTTRRLIYGGAVRSCGGGAAAWCAYAAVYAALADRFERAAAAYAAACSNVFKMLWRGVTCVAVQGTCVAVQGTCVAVQGTCCTDRAGTVDCRLVSGMQGAAGAGRGSPTLARV